MRAFHSNENGLFCTHLLSVAPLFWWKERGKQEALIWLENSHLNRTLKYQNQQSIQSIMYILSIKKSDTKYVIIWNFSGYVHRSLVNWLFLQKPVRKKPWLKKPQMNSLTTKYVIDLTWWNELSGPWRYWRHLNPSWQRILSPCPRVPRRLLRYSGLHSSALSPW